MDNLKITLRDIFDEVEDHHMDQAVRQSMQEFLEDSELQEKVYQIMMASHEVTNAVLSSSVSAGVPPPKMQTAIQMGIIIGIGLAIELLNERDIDFPMDPGTTTIQ